MSEDKTNKESKFKKIKRNIFINMTIKQSKEDYSEMLKYIEQTTGQEPDVQTKRAIRKQIIEKNAKKIEKRAIISAAAIFLSGAIGFGGGHALNEGSEKIEGVTKTENGINIDASELEGEVTIDIPNRESANFRDRYKVTLDNEVVVEHGITESKLIDLYKIKSNVKKEVETLETKDEILNYVKEEYVTEYNKTHEEKISIENVTLYRSNNNITYRDFATNGEMINRICTEDYAKENQLKQIAGSTGQIMTVKVDNKTIEMAVGVLDHFERAYSEKEEVDEPVKDSTLERLGNLLNAGIGYAFAEDNELDYKNDLISAMIEYREKEIERIMNGRMQDNTGFEIED